MCSCEDPLVPMSRNSSHKWSEQHKENVKLVTEVLIKTASEEYAYQPGIYDDMWLERVDDDWVWGKGARFGEDDFGFFVNEQDDMEYDYDDGFGIPMEVSETSSQQDDVRKVADGDRRRRMMDEFGLDVVFVGDSLTEQRQGTSMGRDESSYLGIKEVFDKTFRKDKVCHL